MFWLFFVLVLSIAVLVLVLDRALRHGLGPLDQSREHRHNTFEIGFATTVRFYINCIANDKHIMDRSAFQCRSSRYFKEAILVLQALLTVAFRNLQWNRLGCPQPLIASRSIHTGKSFCNAVRKCHVVNRETIYVESFMIENWLVHQSPFEYEYRFTEYEYDEDRNALMPERHRSASGGGRSVHWRNT